MNKKKVLFVINTLGHAGAEVALLELLRRMQGQDYQVSLYVLTDQGELVSKVPKEVQIVNKTYCEQSVLSKEGRAHLRKKVIKASLCRGSLLRNLPYVVKNGWKMLTNGRVQLDKLLWRVLSDGGQRLEEEYDLAVSFLEGGSAYYVADHVKAKKKAAFLHIDYARAGYTRALDKDCYLKFDRVFTVSEETRENFLKAYPECEAYTDAFHNILNEERILSLSEDGEGFADGYGGYRLLTVGRLVYQKGYDIAIQAMALLKKMELPVRWYILGEGDLRQELEEQIAQAGLEQEFVLLGAKENPYPYYAQADLYVHCTRFEGKSIAIQEAQILGKPIIASDCSGNREQIIHGVDGLLCALTPEAIAEAIRTMYDQPKLAVDFGEMAQKKQMDYEEDIQMLYDLL